MRDRAGMRWPGLFTIVMAFVGLAGVAEAQQAKKVPRIGFLVPGSSSFATPLVDAFRQGLRELGWIEGHNITIDYRWAEAKPERLPDLAAELVRLKVDVIVTAGEPAVRPAQQATKTIPIVMASSSDPVGSGVVASLARPGGNVTGLSAFVRELNAKRLELLKTVVPPLTRVAVLSYSGYEPHARSLKDLETTARALEVKLQSLEVRGPDDLGSAFDAATKKRAEALIVLRYTVILSQQTEIARLSVKHRLASIFDNSEFVVAGGLISYGANIADQYRRAATYVDKILKGAKPADLPVEQPTKFELIINLKTAKQIGLTIPPNVLARADKVVR
jgi:putative ABC transport system substrate-binding protein